MFTVIFALVAILVFFITLILSKLDIKLAFLSAMVTILIGFIFDVLISTYFIALSNMID